jgi:hypothetical protein
VGAGFYSLEADSNNPCMGGGLLHIAGSGHGPHGEEEVGDTDQRGPHVIGRYLVVRERCRRLTRGS